MKSELQDKLTLELQKFLYTFFYGGVVFDTDVSM